MDTTETNQGALGRDCYDRPVSRFVRWLKGYNPGHAVIGPTWANDEIISHIRVKLGWGDRLRVLIHGGIAVNQTTYTANPVGEVATVTKSGAFID